MSTALGLTSALASSLPHSSSSVPSKTPLRFRHPDYTSSEANAAVESESSGDDYSDGEGETTAVDEVQADNYVRKVLAKEKPLPPITLRNWYKEINIVSTLALTVVPALAIYGALTTVVQTKTLIWAIAYYYFTGLGKFFCTCAAPLVFPLPHNF